MHNATAVDRTQEWVAPVHAAADVPHLIEIPMRVDGTVGASRGSEVRQHFHVSGAHTPNRARYIRGIGNPANPLSLAGRLVVVETVADRVINALTYQAADISTLPHHITNRITVFNAATIIQPHQAAYIIALPHHITRGIAVGDAGGAVVLNIIQPHQATDIIMTIPHHITRGIAVGDAGNAVAITPIIHPHQTTCIISTYYNC